MGIPAYFRVITQHHKDIIRTTRPSHCHHLFVDFNGMIHQAAQQTLRSSPNTDADADADDVELERQIMVNTDAYLRHCVEIAQPTKMVHTCVDGVAPVAKMNQQRKRRYMSVFKNKLSVPVGTTRCWDSNAISPGTRFMTKLNTYMKKVMRENTQSSIAHYFSGADECGEGEHKIFARLDMVSNDETAVIYGLDADLIMLSLLSHKPNIFLMREAVHVQQHDKKSQHDDTEYIYMDIHLLRVALLRDLREKYAWPIGDTVSNDPYDSKAKDVIESYVVICFLLGNDFLPHPATLSLKHNGHTKLMHAAKTAWDNKSSGAVDSQTRTVQLQFFTTLLRELSHNGIEDKDMFHVNEEYMKKKAYYSPDSGEPEQIQCYALQEQNKDVLARYLYNMCSHTHSHTQLNSTQLWRNAYYKHLFACSPQSTSTNIISISSTLFIEGLLWTYAYYKRMPSPNPRWYYPYTYAPTLLDISNHIATASLNASENTPSKKDSMFVSPEVQLLSILPRESMSLIPVEKHRSLMLDPSKGCAHLFPTSYKVQTYLNVHLWECSPVLPPLDVKLIESTVHSAFP